MADTTPDEAKAKRDAYTAAGTRLREANREEFNSYLQQEMSKRGITWSPKKTDEDKAKDTVRELLAKYPGLVAELDAPASDA